MSQTLKIDLSEASEAAGLVFAANYVLVIFAIVGLSVEAGDAFFAKTGVSSAHWWERYVTGPAMSLLMLVYTWLAVTMDYSGRYWRWHAAAGGVFATVLVGGVVVALVTLFEFSWTFVIVGTIFLAIFAPIVAAALGLLGASLGVLEARIAIYDMTLPRLLDQVATYYEPLAMQRRRARPKLPFLGRLLMLIAFCGIAFVGIAFVLTGVFEESNAALYETFAGLGGVGMFLLPLWGVLLALGKRLAQPDARRLLDTDARQPVLLLRSFGDDAKKVRSRNVLARYMFLGLRKDMRLEAAIAPGLVGLGPFVAIGEPGEKLPQLGAARSYYRDDEWQAAVLDWMSRARLIVVIAGRSEWVLWELRQIIAGGHLPKTLILFPPGTEEESLQRWQMVHDCLVEGAPKVALDPAMPESALGLHFHPLARSGIYSGAYLGAGSTLLHSKTTKQVDYELAIRLAVFGMFCEPDIVPAGDKPEQ